MELPLVHDAATVDLTVAQVREMRSAWSAHLKRRRSTTAQLLSAVGDVVSTDLSLSQSETFIATLPPAVAEASSQTDTREAKKPNKVVNPWLNDWSQHFVDTQLRPQNFMRRTDLSEYPKLRDLVVLKDKHIRQHATPPMYMKCDLKTFDLTSLGVKFDVILVDPPWEEYSRRTLGIKASPHWTLDEIVRSFVSTPLIFTKQMKLPVEHIMESPSFAFLWVGSAEGLDQGRAVLAKWGFRRCEDICWVKHNDNAPRPTNPLLDKGSILVRTKEHCLMGIRGNVRRNNDGHLIHTNVDTDVIVTQEPPFGSLQKPKEIYHVIEHFAQGRRRLELFGEDHNIRPGWVTLGLGINGASNFSTAAYLKALGPQHLLPPTKEIEDIRPKSPPR